MPNYLNGTLKSARRIFGVHVHGKVGRQAKCVGDALSGSRPGSRVAARANLTAAARRCGSGKKAKKVAAE